MTTRFLFILVTWLAVICANFGFIFSTDLTLLVAPRILVWTLFGVFCAFSLTNCLVRETKSAFWVGTTVFSITALLAAMIADALYQTTLGVIISDIVVYKVYDRETAELIDRLRQDHARSITELVLATAMTVLGGLVGQFLGRSKQKSD